MKLLEEQPRVNTLFPHRAISIFVLPLLMFLAIIAACASRTAAFTTGVRPLALSSAKRASCTRQLSANRAAFVKGLRDTRLKSLGLSLRAAGAGASSANSAGAISGETVQASYPFDVETAVLCAGFAFEAYNEPSQNDARWERGADGCDVAFMSDDFVRECYAGRLEVRLIEAQDLPPPVKSSGLTQALLTGSDPDAYVMFALNEEMPDGGPKEGAVGLVRAVDRARSSTVWSRENSTFGIFQKEKKKKGQVVWGENERHTLYVKDPTRALLSLTVLDEEVLKDDEPLGAASVALAGLLKFNGSQAERRWEGWVPLTWRPSETRDNVVMLGSMAGLAVAGPLGAAAGGLVASLLKKPVQGSVKLEVTYAPLDKQPEKQTAKEKETEKEKYGDAKEKREALQRELQRELDLLAQMAPSKSGEIAQWRKDNAKVCLRRRMLTYADVC